MSKAGKREDKISQAAAPNQASLTLRSQAVLCFPGFIFLPQPPKCVVLLVLQRVCAQIFSTQLIRSQPRVLCLQAVFLLQPEAS